MKTGHLFAIILILLLINTSVWAEKNGKQDDSIVFHCAYSNDEQLQLMALNSLMTVYKQEGSLKKEMMQIPIDLAQDRISPDGSVKTEVQLEAIRLLGEIGGQEALNGLSGLLMSCDDSLILIEAVEASSQIAADDYRYFMSALGSVMKQQHSLFKDNEFAYASLSAIDNITEKSGNILTSEVLGIMMVYSKNEYHHDVRSYSQELLTTILSER